MSDDRIPPYMFVWRRDVGEHGAMVPVRGIARVVASKYQDGMGYLLEPASLGSTPAEKAFYAEVNNAWKQLPESMQADYPSANHLRKRALIKCGFFDVVETVCDTEDDAKRAAALVRGDEFAVVVVNGTVVRKYTPMSMKVRTKKDREQFRIMADAVLGLLADTLGVKRRELQDSTRKDDH